MITFLVNLLIIVLVAGLICYIIRLLPIDGWLKQIALAIVGVVVLIWLLVALFGGSGVYIYHYDSRPAGIRVSP